MMTEAELERLAYLMEECSEVVQISAKILRHGWESRNPDAPKNGTNRQQLESELCDVMGAMALLFKNNDINIDVVERGLKNKNYRYMHHEENNGS